MSVNDSNDKFPEMDTSNTVQDEQSEDEQLKDEQSEDEQLEDEQSEEEEARPVGLDAQLIATDDKANVSVNPQAVGLQIKGDDSTKSELDGTRPKQFGSVVKPPPRSRSEAESAIVRGRKKQQSIDIAKEYWDLSANTRKILEVTSSALLAEELNRRFLKCQKFCLLENLNKLSELRERLVTLTQNTEIDEDLAVIQDSVYSVKSQYYIHFPRSSASAPSSVLTDMSSVSRASFKSVEVLEKMKGARDAAKEENSEAVEKVQRDLKDLEAQKLAVRQQLEEKEALTNITAAKKLEEADERLTMMREHEAEAKREAERVQARAKEDADNIQAKLRQYEAELRKQEAKDRTSVVKFNEQLRRDKLEAERKQREIDIMAEEKKIELERVKKDQRDAEDKAALAVLGEELGLKAPMPDLKNVSLMDMFLQNRDTAIDNEISENKQLKDQALPSQGLKKNLRHQQRDGQPGAARQQDGQLRAAPQRDSHQHTAADYERRRHVLSSTLQRLPTETQQQQHARDVPSLSLVAGSQHLSNSVSGAVPPGDRTGISSTCRPRGHHPPVAQHYAAAAAPEMRSTTATAMGTGSAAMWTPMVSAATAWTPTVDAAATTRTPMESVVTTWRPTVGETTAAGVTTMLAPPDGQQVQSYAPLQQPSSTDILREGGHPPTDVQWTRGGDGRPVGDYYVETQFPGLAPLSSSPAPLPQSNFHPSAMPFYPRLSDLIQGQDMQSAHVAFSPHLDNVHHSQGRPHESTHVCGHGHTTSASEQLQQSLTQTLTDAITLNRLPIAEPQVFTGDSLSYPLWRSAFALLIERQNIPFAEKMLYLQKYVGGQAREALKGLFILRDESAFDRALQILEKRYGTPFVVARAFRDKLEAWPHVKAKDNEGMRAFSDFLEQCLIASQVVGQMNILDDAQFQRRLFEKLPEWVIRKWARIVDRKKNTDNRYPNFSELVDFMSKEAEIANEPVFGLAPRMPTSTSNTGSQSQGARRTMKTDAKETQPCKQCEVHHNRQHRHPLPEKTPNTNSSWSEERKMCKYCTSPDHSIVKCKKLMEKSLSERQQVFMRASLCFACGLTTLHISRGCKNKATCAICKKTHLTLFHDDNFVRNDGRGASSGIKSGDSSSSNINTKSQANSTEPKGTLGATQSITQNDVENRAFQRTTMIVPVYVSTSERPDVEVKTYALLDTMSHITFIADTVCQELDAKSTKATLRLNTMTSQNHFVSCERVSGLRIRPIGSHQYTKLPDAFTTDQLSVSSDNIPTPDTAQRHGHLRHLTSEMHPLQEGCVAGLLIGYDCADILMPLEVIPGSPHAIKTVLGWAIVGNTDTADSFDSLCTSSKVVLKSSLPPTEIVAYVYRTKVSEASTSDLLHMMERDFVETESGSKSQDDMQFLQIVTENVKVNEEGHYQMPLPFRSDDPAPPDNRQPVVMRALGLKRQFEKKPAYKDDYTKFMSDIIEKGHAERVPESEIDATKRWYIPHHGVYNEKKPGKIRVVFDCSTRHHGFCINDELLQGPDLINSLIGVLCRFRKSKVAFSCDIQQMYHQFQVSKTHRDYLRFVWWENGDVNKPLVDFRMKVHIFGATSSPGCANFGLKQVANDHKSVDKDAAAFLTRDFYVDDGLHSEDRVEDAVRILTKAREICEHGCLRLHKITSNSKELLSHFPSTECSGTKHQEIAAHDPSPSVERILGLQWSTEDDVFTFTQDLKKKPETRRGVLSTVASLYDPLGFIAPIVLGGRVILQQVCKEGSDWDDQLSDDLKLQWRTWMEELTFLHEVRIPRSFVPTHFGTKEAIELHHFSDASDLGYGQCSYMRVKDTDGNVHNSLVMAKARVAPLKKVTVPRLELQAATLSTKIARFIHDEIDCENVEHFFWTDSEIVLAYISNEKKRFHVFVANRISQILQFSKVKQWAHVPTAQNPADLASRGANVRDLNKSMWYNGPEFLWQQEVNHSPNQYKLPSNDVEVRATRATFESPVTPTSMEDRFRRFSTKKSLTSGVGVILRWCARKKGEELSVLESRRIAERRIVSCTQQEFFDKPSRSLANAFKQLDVKRDDDGLLRIGGRLSKSTNSRSSQPTLLPKDSHIALLLARDIHEASHNGRTMVINELRARGYWIVGVRRVVSQTIRDCTKCRRLYGGPQSQKMADLPQERVTESAPFTYCGMDCFGPFEVKDGRRVCKRYGLLVTCLASRAVHIEVLEDLSTDALLNGIQRVASIRGNIRLIRCDRGTNFVGASRELRAAWEQVDRDVLQRKLLDRECEWKFNPPTASHMGGVWERQINTVRRVLNGLMKKSDSRLTSDSLRTFLYEVMAIINSRPLSVESLEDPSGPLPLTPNHVLTMKPSGILPPPGAFQEPDLYVRKQWRKAQFLAEEFWRLWRLDYLSTLQRRRKWRGKQPNVEIGDVVVIRDENTRRADWSLAKVTEVYQGGDGLVRSAKLRIPASTSSGGTTTAGSGASELVRPVTKLTVLVKVSQ